MKYCKHCGAEVNENAVLCVKCGCSIAENNDNGASGVSDKKGVVALLLCIFFGYLGVHRFYVGKIGTGVAQLLTCGGCGIWTLIDLIMIISGSFTDNDNKIVKL